MLLLELASAIDTVKRMLVLAAGIGIDDVFLDLEVSLHRRHGNACAIGCSPVLMRQSMPFPMRLSGPVIPLEWQRLENAPHIEVEELSVKNKASAVLCYCKSPGKVERR